MDRVQENTQHNAPAPRAIEVTQIEHGDRAKELIEKLTEVWAASVQATHDFLSPGDFASIREIIPAFLESVPTLLVAGCPGDEPIAFAGIDGDVLEALFVDPSCMGSGVGSRLLERAVSEHGVTRLDVNEQNPNARRFYERRGFRAIGRSELDDAGRPYPTIRMQLVR